MVQDGNIVETGRFGETLYAVASPDQRERPKEEDMSNNTTNKCVK